MKFQYLQKLNLNNVDFDKQDDESDDEQDSVESGFEEQEVKEEEEEIHFTVKTEEKVKDQKHEEKVQEQIEEVINLPQFSDPNDIAEEKQNEPKIIEIKQSPQKDLQDKIKTQPVNKEEDSDNRKVELVEIPEKETEEAVLHEEKTKLKEVGLSQFQESTNNKPQSLFLMDYPEVNESEKNAHYIFNFFNENAHLDLRTQTINTIKIPRNPSIEMISKKNILFSNTKIFVLQTKEHTVVAGHIGDEASVVEYHLSDTIETNIVSISLSPVIENDVSILVFLFTDGTIYAVVIHHPKNNLKFFEIEILTRNSNYPTHLTWKSNKLFYIEGSNINSIHFKVEGIMQLVKGQEVKENLLSPVYLISEKYPLTDLTVSNDGTLLLYINQDNGIIKRSDSKIQELQLGEFYNKSVHSIKLIQNTVPGSKTHGNLFLISINENLVIEVWDMNQIGNDNLILVSRLELLKELNWIDKRPPQSFKVNLIERGDLLVINFPSLYLLLMIKVDPCFKEEKRSNFFKDIRLIKTQFDVMTYHCIESSEGNKNGNGSIVIKWTDMKKLAVSYAVITELWEGKSLLDGVVDIKIENEPTKEELKPDKIEKKEDEKKTVQMVEGEEKNNLEDPEKTENKVQKTKGIHLPKTENEEPKENNNNAVKNDKEEIKDGSDELAKLIEKKVAGDQLPLNNNKKEKIKKQEELPPKSANGEIQHEKGSKKQKTHKKNDDHHKPGGQMKETETIGKVEKIERKKKTVIDMIFTQQLKGGPKNKKEKKRKMIKLNTLEKDMIKSQSFEKEKNKTLLTSKDSKKVKKSKTVEQIKDQIQKKNDKKQKKKEKKDVGGGSGKQKNKQKPKYKNQSDFIYEKKQSHSQIPNIDTIQEIDKCSLTDILDRHLKNTFIPKIDKHFSVIQTAIASQNQQKLSMKDDLKHFLQTELKEELKKTIRNELGKVMKEEFREQFEVQVIPIFEKYLSMIFKKTEAMFHRGFKYYTDKLGIEEKKINQLKEQLSPVTSSFQTTAKVVSTVLKETMLVQKEFSKATKEMNQERMDKLENNLKEVAKKQDKLLDVFSIITTKLENLEKTIEINTMKREQNYNPINNSEISQGTVEELLSMGITYNNPKTQKHVPNYQAQPSYRYQQHFNYPQQAIPKIIHQVQTIQPSPPPTYLIRPPTHLAGAGIQQQPQFGVFNSTPQMETVSQETLLLQKIKDVIVNSVRNEQPQMNKE